MAQGAGHRQSYSPPRVLSQPTQGIHVSLDFDKGGGGWWEDNLGQNCGLGQGFKVLTWWALVCIYVYLLCLAGRRVNYALVNVESKLDVARTIGGALMCLTVPLATYQIVLHLSNFVEPRQQSQIVRIVFMVPTYSITAFLSLRFMHWSLFIATVRECYEAYVIYCFLHFLVGTLGDGLPAANSRLAAMPPVVGRHTPPFCCLEPWQMGREFLQRCQAGVFQYVFIRLVSTGVALGLQLVHLYAEGDFDPKSGYLWITVVTCLSQSWALYVLVLFYRATHKEMAHIHPMGKFLTIKTIVFFSWWQGILIEFLEGRGHFASVVGISSADGRDPADHVAQGIQDLLICLEMLVAAVFFFYAFPLSDYLPLQQQDHESPREQDQVSFRLRFPGNYQSKMDPRAGEGSSSSQSGSHAGRAEVTPKWKGQFTSAIHLSSHKSHPRLDLINRSTRPSRQTRLPILEALRQSANPMELRVDFREILTSISEAFAFLTKRKVEARQRGGAGGGGAGVGLGMGRVMTL